MTQTMASRRASLATVAALATAGSVFTAVAAAAPFSAAEGDAELLELWRQYLSLFDDWAASGDDTGEAFEPAWSALADRMAAIVPTTPAGVAIHLRMALMESDGCTVGHERYVNLEAVDAGAIEREVGRFLWLALVNLERQLGIEPPVRA